MRTTATGESGPQLALACIVDAIPAAERSPHFALIGRLFRQPPRAPRAIPDGYAFTFEADDFTDVARFVENERRCCPFLTFALEIAPGGGALELRLTGPAGTRPLLDAELLGARNAVG